MIGQTLRNFRIVSEIGEGGMGVVYLAEHINLPKRFAVKSLSLSLSQDPHFRSRFYDEAQKQAILDHPNIVQVTDFFEAEGQFFLVMEFVDGQDLGKLIKAKGKLPEHEALPIFRDILRGLDFAHSKGVIHRDVKPSNVLIDSQGRARIMDFGISILAGAGDKRLTATGAAVGSPWYMSPEQIQHPRQLDSRTDIYSLGIVLYEMLAGDVPFNGETDFRVQEQQIHSPPPNLRQNNPEISQELAEIVQKAMAKNPAERYQDCTEFLHAIEEYEINRRLLPRPPEKLPNLPAWGLAPIITAWKRVFAKKENPNHRLEAETEGKAEERSRTAGFQSGKRCARGHSMDPNWDSCPYCEAEERSRARQSRERTRVDATVVEAVPSVDRVPTVNVEAMRRPLSPQDVTSIFPNAAPSEQSLLPEIALAITQCANPSLLGKKIPLTEFPFRIGRANAHYIISDDEGISREHLILDYKSGVFTVCDAGSKNGTYVNGRQLQHGQPEPLLFGAVIRLSSITTFTFVPGALHGLPDLTGQIIDNRFSLTKLLHFSAKAAVYAARDQRFPRDLAVKVFSPQLATFPAYMEQFRREAETAVLLRHPQNICRVLDFGSANIPWGSAGMAQAPYLCMDLMDGGSLADRVAEEKLISLDQITSWIEKLGNALDDVHKQGMIHSGIKLSSIVFDQGNQPYLTDFAIASRPLDETRSPVIGAPAFLAPEQWEGNPTTPATDQFSLAVVTYILMTGARPYEGQENPEVRKKNFARGPVPAHEEAKRNGRTDITVTVSNVLERALAIKPEDRYSSVGEFAHALEVAASGKSVRHDGEPRIFISYHRESSAPWANYLARELKQHHGISSFIDTQQRDGAVRFPERIQRVIEQCDVFVCLLASSTLESPWVKDEIKYAHKTKRPMVPVFQESFRSPEVTEELEPHLKALLNYDGVHLFDLRNIHVDHTVGDLAQMVKRTVEQS